MSTVRNVCFTYYNPEWEVQHYTEDELASVKGLNYFIAGRETCPSTGRLHWQGYAEFDNSISLRQVKVRLKCGGAHIDRRRGTAQEAADYCKKEDPEPLEWGTISSQGRRSDIEQSFDDIDSGVQDVELARRRPGTWAVHRRAFREYRALIEPKRDWVTEVIYIHGPSGCGKTRMAKEAGATTVQYDGRFFLGYNGEDVVLFDDINIDTFENASVLLQLTDRYDYLINVKGGERNWKPRTIYFTSNWTLLEIGWQNSPMRRRITEVIDLQA